MTNRTVLMRVDFNVPIRPGRIVSDRRIVQAIPTIRLALEKGAKLVLMSHLGRPAGSGFEKLFSMRPVAERLGTLLGLSVQLGPREVVGKELDAAVARMKSGDVLLMENLRFHSGETMPDQKKKQPNGKLTPEQQKVHDQFAASIAAHGDVYVNDAFGTCHREHASMYGVPKVMTSRGLPAVAGLLVKSELGRLSETLARPRAGFVLVLGGAKLSDKIKLISRLSSRVERVIIGGAMAYTLLAAQGHAIGKSLVESDRLSDMAQLLEQARDQIVLPCDHVATDWFDPKRMAAGELREVDSVDMPADLLGMDLGPKSIKAFGDIIQAAKTIVWNGPMGVYEMPAYATGTRAIVKIVADAADNGAFAVIGGGDSATVVEELGLAEAMTHVSTGGGATLAYLEGRPMPAIDILDDK